jgi:hypothetical protein
MHGIAMAQQECMARMGADGEDAAWVTIDTPLPVQDLRDFLDDVERLYRIIPLLEFKSFAPLGDGRWRVLGRNLSNGRDIDLELTVRKHALRIDVLYSVGLKTATTFQVEPAPAASRLIVKDCYGGVDEAEQRQRMGEVDLSLTAWGRALHAFIRHWSRWGWLGPWRWYMRKVWQPMTPSSRRIVFMLWLISAVEVISVLFILALWAALRA